MPCETIYETNALWNNLWNHISDALTCSWPISFDCTHFPLDKNDTTIKDAMNDSVIGITRQYIL